MQEGINYVRYFSIDNANNQESTKSTGEIKIDKTPPEITAPGHTPEPVIGGTPVLLKGTVSDSISGVASTKFCTDAACTGVRCADQAFVTPGSTKAQSCSALTQECSFRPTKYYITVEDLAGNIAQYEGTYNVKKGGTCPCTTVEECVSGVCTLGVCTEAPNPPEIEFFVEAPDGTTSKTVVIEVGSEAAATLKITNTLEVTDNIDLQLLGSPKKIEFWSWWSGHRTDEQKVLTAIQIDAGQESAAIANILAGQVGEYTLSVLVSSRTSGFTASDDLQVIVIPKGAQLGRAPGLGLASLLLIALLGAFIIRRPRIIYKRR